MKGIFGVAAIAIVMGFVSSSLGGALGAAAPAVHTLSTSGASGVLPAGPAFPHSSRYAGYEILTATASIKDVRANWRVPQIAKLCSSRFTSSTFLVGMDGASGSGASALVGTRTGCSSGSAYYSAWVVLGGFSRTLSITIAPADHVYGEVKYNSGPRSMTVIFKDLTTGKSYSHTLSGSTARIGAVWLAEDPYATFATLYPLTDFGWVTFTNASATIGGHTHNIGGFSSSWQAWTMWGINFNGAKATTSALSNHGSQFVVTWKRAGP
jgi:Peptidase A4 family